MCRTNLPLGVAEDDSLCDGEGVVEVTERVKLPLLPSPLPRRNCLMPSRVSSSLPAGEGGEGRGEGGERGRGGERGGERGGGRGGERGGGRGERGGGGEGGGEGERGGGRGEGERGERGEEGERGGVHVAISGRQFAEDSLTV